MTTMLDDHATRGSEVWRKRVSRGQLRRLERLAEAPRRDEAANDPLLMRDGESLEDWLARTVTRATAEQLYDAWELDQQLAVRGIQVAVRVAMDRMVIANAVPRGLPRYREIRREAWRVLYQELRYLRVPVAEIKGILTWAVGEFPEASA